MYSYTQLKSFQRKILLYIYIYVLLKLAYPNKNHGFYVIEPQCSLNLNLNSKVITNFDYRASKSFCSGFVGLCKWHEKLTDHWIRVKPEHFYSLVFG